LGWIPIYILLLDGENATFGVCGGVNAVGMWLLLLLLNRGVVSMGK
jgi:hypothetical protein